MARKRILIFADYYLPSIGAGGGVRLLANIVERFSDRYEFFVVARDHDSKSDRRPFTNMPRNTWTSCGAARAYYFSKNQLTSKVTDKIIGFAKPDLVFLNSLFSVASVRFLWERRKGKYKGLPVIVSPCGEVLSEGLKHKTFKKKSYLTVANAAGLHESIVWRATTEKEKADITAVIGNSPNTTFVVPDLAPKEICVGSSSNKPVKSSGFLRLSYIARIVPNKNLLFLLDVLSRPYNGQISLQIIGPRENVDYWAKCSQAISNLPSNIHVDAVGLVPHKEVLDRLHESHVFILPTETENFGYVIVEALALGCPVIISDRTHWNYLAGNSFANVLGLGDRSAWHSAIQDFLSMDETAFVGVSNAAKEFARRWLSSSEAEAKMEQLFEHALRKEDRGAVR
ncbi:MAG TPA: glycosyltransferase family 4 protein [Pyrinomonadaceae bacterium]